MSPAESVLACALSLLMRSASTFPPIVLLDRVPAGVSPSAEAFVPSGTGTIYVITSSAAFQAAFAPRGHACGARTPLKKLASVLVHEEWHVRNGGDEEGAYHAQLITLLTLGVAPDSSLYVGVSRSMQRVIKDRHDSPAKRPPDSPAEIAGLRGGP